MLCLPCLGSVEFPSGRPCPRCAGGGDLPDTRVTNPMCPYCVGTGRDPFHKGKLCSECDGWGRVSGPADVGRDSDTVHATPHVPAGETQESGNSDSLYVQPTRNPTQLEELLRELAGDVDVCDPSLTEDSLNRLRLLDRCDMIRVLTYDVDADLFPRIREFVLELPRFLFRRYGGREIRDRYLLTGAEVIYLGPGPGDGDDDSPTLIRVPADMAVEMIQDVRVGFNRLWSAGDKLA